MRKKSIMVLLGLSLLIGVSGWVSWKFAGAPSTEHSQTSARTQTSAKFHPVPAPDVSFEVAGKKASISQYAGHKIMLWLFSTWCSSCEAGLKALAKHRLELAQDGVTLIVLDNYKNDGYPGLTTDEFVQKVAPELESTSGWIFGTASKTLAETYNPKGFPDIYFLIDSKGLIQAVSGSPNVTMQKILRFAKTGQ
ncbi:peroxiredoxin family protein [Acidihalobacter yilgarnensis]|nr:redoxin domain-containing protein [Acidihalobacter yilgarnensis]